MKPHAGYSFIQMPQNETQPAQPDILSDSPLVDKMLSDCEQRLQAYRGTLESPDITDSKRAFCAGAAQAYRLCVEDLKRIKAAPLVGPVKFG